MSDKEAIIIHSDMALAGAATGAAAGAAASSKFFEDYAHFTQDMRVDAGRNKDIAVAAWNDERPGRAMMYGEVALAKGASYAMLAGGQKCMEHVSEHPYRSAAELVISPISFVADALCHRK